MSRLKLPQEVFPQPLENASCTRKLDLLRNQSTGSHHRALHTDLPDKQLLLVSRYVLHEQLFQDGLWHHIQENCFRGFHEGIHEGLETMQMLSGPGDIPFACQCTHLGVPNTYILEQHSPGCCLHNRWEVYFLHSAACLIASVASQIL